MSNRVEFMLLYEGINILQSRSTSVLISKLEKFTGSSLSANVLPTEEFLPRWCWRIEFRVVVSRDDYVFLSFRVAVAYHIAELFLPCVFTVRL